MEQLILAYGSRGLEAGNSEIATSAAKKENRKWSKLSLSKSPPLSAIFPAVQFYHLKVHTSQAPRMTIPESVGHSHSNHHIGSAQMELSALNSFFFSMSEESDNRNNLPEVKDVGSPPRALGQLCPC